MSCKLFNECVLRPVSGEHVEKIDGKWKASSFFMDSSGRSSIFLPLELQFPSREILTEFASCFHPIPEGLDEAEQVVDKDGRTTKTICIEAKVTLTFGTGHAISARVERVKIHGTKVQENSAFFDTEISVCVTQEDKMVTTESGSVKTNLEISAAYYERSAFDTAASAFEILDMWNRNTESFFHRNVAQLAPFTLHVSLKHALSVAVRSLPGPAMGHTFLALTMSHSNTHSQPVTITSINLHASHTGQKSDSIEGLAVTDMSSNVQWAYAPKSDPQLPLVLLPNESVATILSVHASEDSLVRRCVCPLSVTAVVGKNSIVAATEATWTSCRSAVEPADSFRVDMTLAEDSECIVGAPLQVNMEITNLSTESRQLMLIVDIEAPKKTVVVSEKGGYRFGLWGMPSNTSLEFEQELLAVDAALLLGEVKGQSSTRAKLRVIPLREGTLSIPNFKLVDSRTGKRYNCIHKLQAVVQAGKR